MIHTSLADNHRAGLFFTFPLPAGPDIPIVCIQHFTPYTPCFPCGWCPATEFYTTVFRLPFFQNIFHPLPVSDANIWLLFTFHRLNIRFDEMCRDTDS